MCIGSDAQGAVDSKHGCTALELVPNTHTHSLTQPHPSPPQPPTTSEMVTICPVTPLPCGARVAPLGLAGMLNGAFTVAKAGADGARAFEAAVAGPGRAAFYASRMPEVRFELLAVFK